MLKMGYPTISYAPDGEDIILRNMLRGTNAGFYVDVGAYHPTRFSNTKQLYQSGWSGINIDSMPGSMGSFNKERPRDTNLEIAISDKKEILTYRIFTEQAYNTLSDEQTKKCTEAGHKMIKEVKLQVSPLSDILDKYLPKKRSIDLLTIDVEGLDLNVLRSNNWNLYRPKVIAIEEIGFNAENPRESEIFDFLKERGYRLEVATPKTIFFRLYE